MSLRKMDIRTRSIGITGLVTPVTMVYTYENRAWSGHTWIGVCIRSGLTAHRIDEILACNYRFILSLD